MLARKLNRSLENAAHTKKLRDRKLRPLPAFMSDTIRSYAELRELIRVSLRIQNPEWVEPNGDSPVCDSYETRFAELLELTQCLHKWHLEFHLKTRTVPGANP